MSKLRFNGDFIEETSGFAEVTGRDAGGQREGEPTSRASQTKFTPGSWEVCQDHSGAVCRIDAQAQPTWRQIVPTCSDDEESRVPVCEFRRPESPGMPSYDETGATLLRQTNRANARLIAAAPELFEALVNAFHYIHMDGNKEMLNGWSKERFLEQIQAAIAKAEGES